MLLKYFLIAPPPVFTLPSQLSHRLLLFQFLCPEGHHCLLKTSQLPRVLFNHPQLLLDHRPLLGNRPFLLEVVSFQQLQAVFEILQLLLVLGIHGLVLVEPHPATLHLLSPLFPVTQLGLLLRQVQFEGTQLPSLALQPLLQVGNLNLLAVYLLDKSVGFSSLSSYCTLLQVSPATLGQLLAELVDLGLVVMGQGGPTMLPFLVKLSNLLLVVTTPLPPVRLILLSVQLPLRH